MAPNITLEMHTDVVVKLTQYGAEVLNVRNRELRKYFEDNNILYYGYRTDYKEGDSFQQMLWEIFQLFGGDKCYNGAKVPFTELTIYTE